MVVTAGTGKPENIYEKKKKKRDRFKGLCDNISKKTKKIKKKKNK